MCYKHYTGWCAQTMNASPASHSGTLDQVKMFVKITGASPGLWYADYVGQEFAVIEEDADCWITREPDGFKNVIWRQHGRKCRAEGDRGRAMRYEREIDEMMDVSEDGLVVEGAAVLGGWWRGD